MYVLWRPEGRPAPEWSAAMLHGLVADLLALEPRGLQLNLVDGHVVPAWGGGLVVEAPPPEAVVSLWLDTAVPAARQPFETRLADPGIAARLAGYLVTESEPIVNTAHPAGPGTRTWGFSQVAFLRRPERLAVDEFIDTWHRGQTPVAIETQSTFRYVQNVVARALLPGPPWAGIVEECFPAEAMTDLHVFYDAVGDEERLARNMTRMMESVGRFTDPGQVEVIWTSQYVLRTPW